MSLEKRNVILGIIICVAVAAIGISFAYFTSSTNIGGTGSSVEVTPGEMIEVIYDAGNQTLDLANAVPGDSAVKNFSVTLNPTETQNDAKYAIKLNITANSFTNNSIRYTLSDDTGILATSTLTDNQTGEIVIYTDTKTVDTDTTFNYTLKVEFVETNTDQTENTNKSLTGTVEVVFAS